MRITFSYGLFFAVFITLTGLGCDSGPGDNRIILSHTFSDDVSGNPIRISFDGADVQAGEVRNVSCNCSLDVGLFLASRSFSKSELLSATITSAKIKSVFPIGERLDYLTMVSLILESSELPPKTVATRESFPSSQESALSTIPDVNTRDILASPEFSSALSIELDAVDASTQYQLSLEFTVELTLEGL